MEPIFVGLGGNVGDVRASFAEAVRRMGERAEVRLSSLWETEPVGPVAEQPAFLNAVAELEVAQAEPREFLAWLHGIERALGRDRARETAQGPRTIDLDLLLWGDRRLVSEELVIPHPRLHERAFALAPLEELVGPEWIVPGGGRVGDLLAAARKRQKVRKIA